jgi:hypothetical protein
MIVADLNRWPKYEILFARVLFGERRTQSPEYSEPTAGWRRQACKLDA